MDMPRLSKSVRRITVLQRDGTGATTSIVLYKRGRKKKKSSRLMKPVEKLARTVADASDAATGTYLRRHKKSNRKRKDGWVRDLPNNIVRATTKAAKEIRPAALLGL